MEGMPMPWPITLTRLPLCVPVKPSMPRTLLNCTGFSRNFSAMNLALSGSPAIITVSAISPLRAPIWGVGVLSIMILLLRFLNLLCPLSLSAYHTFYCKYNNYIVIFLPFVTKKCKNGSL